jgi:hypothetical protein
MSPNCPDNPQDSNKEFRKNRMIEGKELSRQNPYLKDQLTQDLGEEEDESLNY